MELNPSDEKNNGTSDSSDSLADFQEPSSHIDTAISGLGLIRNMHHPVGLNRSKRKRIKRKRGPPTKIVSNKWYFLPAGSPVPNFQKGHQLLRAHSRDGYGFPATYTGENGEGICVPMALTMSQEQFSERIMDLFPKLRSSGRPFQVYTWNRQKLLEPVVPNHPSGLCPINSSKRYRGIVFIKEVVEDPSNQEQANSSATGGIISSTLHADLPADSSSQAHRSSSTTGGTATSTLCTDSPAIPNDFVSAGTPSVLFRQRRLLIEEQNQAFEESLRIDSERDANEQAAAQRESRRLAIIQERKNRLVEEPSSGGHIKIRFPDGSSDRRRFDLSKSIEELLNFIGTHDDATEMFSIHIAGSGETLQSTATGTCTSLGIQDRSSIFVTWQDNIQEFPSGNVSLDPGPRLIDDTPPYDSQDLDSLPEIRIESDGSTGATETENDWKTELMAVQRPVQLSDAPSSNNINVLREFVIEGARRAINRRKFDPLKKIKVAFIDADGNEEGSIDNGGPTREFFRLLMQKVMESTCFEGPPDARELALSTKAVDQKEYKNVGAFIALSIIHGGPGPVSMSECLFDELTGTPAIPQLDSISDDYVKNQLSRIKHAGNVDEARSAVVESLDLLSILGTSRYIGSLDERDQLVHDAVRFYRFGRLHSAIDQLREGLNIGGVMDMMKRYPMGYKPLFVASSDTVLCPMALQELFKPRYSETGSNKRRVENRIVSYWRDWLISIADEESLITLEDLLIFSTAASRIPPLGFPFDPCLEFHHDRESPFPTANTCALVLRLPLHDTYDDWKSKMESGIIQSPGFGVS